jgi:hypothetical protein
MRDDLNVKPGEVEKVRYDITERRVVASVSMV